MWTSCDLAGCASTSFASGRVRQALHVASAEKEAFAHLFLAWSRAAMRNSANLGHVHSRQLSPSQRLHLLESAKNKRLKHQTSRSLARRNDHCRCRLRHSLVTSSMRKRSTCGSGENGQECRIPGLSSSRSAGGFVFHTPYVNPATLLVTNNTA